jgi:quinol monooxygenase YgiN
MMMTSIKIILPRKHKKDVFEALVRFKQLTEISMGCISCHINRDVEKTNTITYSEEWQSRHDLEKHIRSPNYRQVLEIIELSVQEPEIKFFTVSKIEGLEVVKTIRIST